ncbi:Golgi-associated RAB2 interactor protein 5B [Dasypus novemcinctus]|uniref:Golgi-associated RAB2 interactor protein 5B n=1 Tax=Dasypus novemcinctus TaxID=9361 RepID=UPI00265F92FC|nr:Golgi-associated RAB2 interactor protein 5B [Dasypus novemcinctus]
MNRFRNIRCLRLFHSPPKWVPTLGQLQKTLQKGEYLPLRPLPMFESNFVQVTNHGGPVYLHHRTNRLTMGVAASLPGLVLPDILLLARPPEGEESSRLDLTRMIPLDLAHLYVHDLATWRLKLRLVTGRYYYLELDAPDEELGFLFDRWIRLIDLLRQPARAWAPRTLHSPPLELRLSAPPASTWRLQTSSSHSRCAGMAAKGTFLYTTVTPQRQRKAKSLKRNRVKSQAVGDSEPLLWSQLELASVRKKSKHRHEKCRPGRALDRGQTEIQVSGDSEEPSLVIRTIFSIVSSTANQRPSSVKSTTSETDARERLAETPSFCLSGGSPDFSGSCDQMERFLLQEDIEALMDPTSTTMSSSSLGPEAPCALFYQPAAYASLARPGEKARPLLPQRVHSEPLISWKAPFILDQSQRAPPVPAASQRAPPVPVSHQKAPPAPAPSQRAPAVPTPYLKTPAVPAPSQRAPAVPTPYLKTPAVPATSQRAPAVPTPYLKTPAVPAPSQRAPAVPTPYLKTPAVPATSQRAPLAPAVPQKARSLILPDKKSPFQKALDPVTPQPITLTPPIPPDGSAGLGTLLGGDVLERSKPKGKPELVVGAQEVNVVELRTQATSLELPFTTARESEEVLISKSWEISLEGLTGRRKLEGRAHGKKEEFSLDLGGIKSKEVERQKRWVKIQAAALEEPLKEDTRPFSVEGLALAKLIIMASSKEQQLRPQAVTLPSWLSLTPKGSAVSREGSELFDLKQVSWLERTPVEVREQPESSVWTKESTKHWRKVEELPRHLMEDSKVSFHALSPSSSPSMESGPRPPIALPATRWEDVEPQPIPLTPSKRDVKARMSQQPLRTPEEAIGMPSQPSLAVTGSSSSMLFPVLVGTDSIRGSAPSVPMVKEEARSFTALPRTQGSQLLK